MENKYFIPNIEDLHIGYDCEIYNQYSSKLIKKVGWHSVKVNCSPEMSKYVGILQCKKLIKTQHIRVPYLTKEQIEAEGWEYVKNTNKVDVDICHIFNKNNYMLGWFPLINKIVLLVRDPSKAFDKNGVLVEYNNTERYTGQCKDINTFKKLTKLLEI